MAKTVTAGARYGLKLETLIGAGDCIVGVDRCHVTRRNTCKAMDARVVHPRRVKGSLVRHFEQFTDTRLVAQAMR